MTPRPVILCIALILMLTATVIYAQSASTAAPEYLASIRQSPELQEFLEQTVAALAVKDPQLRRSHVRIALLDLTNPNAPRLAHYHGESPIYPASVVKFVYLMAVYKWQEEGKVHIDSELDALLTQMIHVSSNQATQAVFARLTSTAPGPELSADAYREFRDRRLSVDTWLNSLGVSDLHCVNPTYDGDGDLSGRDKQFIA